MPDTVQNMGIRVFDGCTSLEQVDLPTTLKDIWQYGFARCGIREIRLPENVERLIPFTFQDCRNLEKIYCMPGLKEVQAYAFRGCRKDIQLVTMRILKISPKAFEDR